MRADRSGRWRGGGDGGNLCSDAQQICSGRPAQTGVRNEVHTTRRGNASCRGTRTDTRWAHFIRVSSSCALHTSESFASTALRRAAFSSLDAACRAACKRKQVPSRDKPYTTRTSCSECLALSSAARASCSWRDLRRPRSSLGRSVRWAAARGRLLRFSRQQNCLVFTRDIEPTVLLRGPELDARDVPLSLSKWVMGSHKAPQPAAACAWNLLR